MSYRGRQRRPRDPRTGKLYRIISSSPKLSPPPTVLRRAKLDNLALIPASLLPFKAQYQDLANTLPEGDVLIILPTSDTPSKKTLEKVSDLMKARGQRVTTIPAEKLTPTLTY